jgi:hypothetical protein
MPRRRSNREHTGAPVAVIIMMMARLMKLIFTSEITW